MSFLVYFLSQFPVFLFLREPFGHRLGSVFLSQFPVTLFFRLPFGHRFLLSLMEVVFRERFGRRNAFGIECDATTEEFGYISE